MPNSGLVFIFLITLLISGCEREYGKAEDNDLVFKLIAKGVYQYTAFKEIKGFGRVGANGMIVVKGKRALLIDAPWNRRMTQRIHQWIHENNLSLDAVAITHWHNDRSAGLNYLQQQRVFSYAHQLTNTELENNGLTQANHGFSGEKMVLHSFDVELIYPGSGHTRDNIVVWLDEQKILFGGCLVKSSDAINLGYTKDADLPGWSGAIQHLLDSYPDAKLVIPGHGQGNGLLTTLRLLAAG